jgi:hypothetical protein
MTDTLLQGRPSTGVDHRGPLGHPDGDRSLDAEDPERNVAGIWDFFHRGERRRAVADACTDEDVCPDTSH